MPAVAAVMATGVMAAGEDILTGTTVAGAGEDILTGATVAGAMAVAAE